MKKIVTLGLAGALAAGAMAVGPIGVNAASVVDSHAAWCEQNYRSYNPATDTFVGSDGHVYRCLSPFSDTRTFSAVSPNIVILNGTPSRANPDPGTGTTYRVFPGDETNGTPNQGPFPP
jgi:hypothetical protein